MAEIPLVSVIDDSHSLRREVATVIRSAGFAVEVFASAEEFVRSNQMPSTACLVINAQQRGMSGLQLQSHLASAGRHIPIIFITAAADQKARTQASELGAVNILDKPSGEKALLKEICLVLKSGDREGRTTPHPPER